MCTPLFDGGSTCNGNSEHGVALEGNYTFGKVQVLKTMEEKALLHIQEPIERVTSKIRLIEKELQYKIQALQINKSMVYAFTIQVQHGREKLVNAKLEFEAIYVFMVKVEELVDTKVVKKVKHIKYPIGILSTPKKYLSLAHFTMLSSIIKVKRKKTRLFSW